MVLAMSWFGIVLLLWLISWTIVVAELEIVVVRPLPNNHLSRGNHSDKKSHEEEPQIVSIECFDDNTRGTTSADSVHAEDCCREAWSALRQNVSINSNANENVDKSLWLRQCLGSVVEFPAIMDSKQLIPRFMAMVTPIAGSTYSNEATIVWDVERSQRIVTDDTYDKEQLQALLPQEYQLKSTLSTSGGMHRRLDHQIHFLAESMNITTTTTGNHTATRKRCIDIPMYFPADFFVNIEDLFRPNTNTDVKNNIEIMLREPIPNVDQEEPSFASRPFGLVVQVCNNNHHVAATTNTEVATVVVSFAMELHSRYPKPCGGTNPYYYDGNNYKKGYTVVRWGLSGNVLLEYDVACPNGDDYPTLVLLSVAVSLLGAMVTLRNIAAVSQWT